MYTGPVMEDDRATGDGTAGETPDAAFAGIDGRRVPADAWAKKDARIVRQPFEKRSEQVLRELSRLHRRAEYSTSARQTSTP